MDPKLGLALLIAAAAAAMAATAAPGEWVEPVPMSLTSTCEGRVGDCIEPEEETMMGSEGAHRQLWNSRRYISYNAMSKNNIPCNRAGSSYYNCRGNYANNPYRRGCTQITMCARTW